MGDQPILEFIKENENIRGAVATKNGHLLKPLCARIVLSADGETETY